MDLGLIQRKIPEPNHKRSETKLTSGAPTCPPDHLSTDETWGWEHECIYKAERCVRKGVKERFMLTCSNQLGTETPTFYHLIRSSTKELKRPRGWEMRHLTREQKSSWLTEAEWPSHRNSTTTVKQMYRENNYFLFWFHQELHFQQRSIKQKNLSDGLE